MSTAAQSLPTTSPEGAYRARGWLVVAVQEMRDLWLSGRGLTLVLGFSLLLSVLTYLTAANQDLNLLDQRDTVNLVVQVTVAIGVALALLLAADAVSGERERGTLEALLLTPLHPREIALGKLLAAFTVWPVVLAIAVPYIWALRAGNDLFTDALFAGALVGSILAVAFVSFGIIMSTISATNRASLGISFFLFVATIIPTQLPGGATKGWLGTALSRINPLTAGQHYMDRITVSNYEWTYDISWLISPVVAALGLLVLAAVITGRLRLQGGLT